MGWSVHIQYYLDKLMAIDSKLGGTAAACIEVISFQRKKQEMISPISKKQSTNSYIHLDKRQNKKINMHQLKEIKTPYNQMQRYEIQ